MHRGVVQGGARLSLQNSGKMLISKTKGLLRVKSCRLHSVPREEGGGKQKRQQKRRPGEAGTKRLARSLQDTHSQGAGTPPCPGQALQERGSCPKLQCAHSNSYREAGTRLLSGGWGEFQNIMSCRKGDKGAIFFPQPSLSGLCRCSAASFILHCQGRTAFHLSAFP